MEKPEGWKLCGRKGRDNSLEVEDCLETQLRVERRGRKMVDQNPRKGLEGQMLGLEMGSRIEAEIL